MRMRMIAVEPVLHTKTLNFAFDRDVQRDDRQWRETTFPYALTGGQHSGQVGGIPRGPTFFNYRNYTIFGFPFAWAVDPVRCRLERMYTPFDVYCMQSDGGDISGYTAGYNAQLAPGHWYCSTGKAYGYWGSEGHSYIPLSQRVLWVWTLDTGRVERIHMSVLPATADGAYTGFVILGSVRDWILGIVYTPSTHRVIAFSRKDPRIQRFGSDIPELSWLCRAVEGYGALRGMAPRVLRDIGGGDLSRYVYIVAQPSMSSNARYLTDSALFLDFGARQGWQVATGSMVDVHNPIVTPDGLMYIPAGYMPAICNPFERTLQVFPLGSIRNIGVGYGTEQFDRMLFASETELLVSSSSSRDAAAAVLVNIYTGEYATMTKPPREEFNGDSTAYANMTFYPLCDTAGNLFASGRPPGSQTRFADPGMLYRLGTFGSRSIYPPDGGVKSDLGAATRRWGILAANHIGNGDGGGVLLRTRALLAADDANALDPMAVGEDDEGRVLRVSNGVWRKVAALGEVYPPSARNEGDVVVIKDGFYDTAPEPSPLPDWFNGCTPVVRDGYWQAGDALYRMPKNARRNNLTFFSKAKKWEPRGLPFTVTAAAGAVLTTVFPQMTRLYHAWYVFASGSLTNLVSETVPHVDGYSPGLVKKLPDPRIDAYGANREELGITGNYNNNYFVGHLDSAEWTAGSVDGDGAWGAEGVDTSYLSNRPLTLFNSVVNTGMGQWEVGDIIETSRKRLDDISDSWRYLENRTTVNRLEDYEPYTLCGEEHYELFTMLARYMNRMWLYEPIPSLEAVKIELQVSTDPTFTKGVTERATETDNTGWWFLHRDGDSSVFLSRGTAATDCVGVIFDPSTAGLSYVTDTGHARYRIAIGPNAAFSEWRTPEFIDARNNWWNIRQIECQHDVNHFVLPKLSNTTEPEFNRRWLYSKEPVTPLGGAKIFMFVTPATDGALDVEVEVGDSIVFTHPRTERRSSADSPVGFTVIGGDDREVAWPAGSRFSAAAGSVHVVFDPVAAAVSSRVGARFYRWRTIRNGVVGAWRVGKTVTTQATQVRLDMLNVLGSEEHRDADGVIPMVRDAGNKTIVIEENVIPACGEQIREGSHILSPVPVEGAATVLAHGIYRSNTETENYWRFTQAIQIVNRHYKGRAPLYEEQCYTDYTALQGQANLRPTSATRYLMPAPYVYSSIADSATYTHMLHRFPGSRYFRVTGEPDPRGEFGRDNAYGIGTGNGAFDEEGRFLALPHETNTVVYDRVLGTFANVPRFNEARTETDIPFYVGDGIFLLPSLHGLLPPRFLEPSTMAVVEHGRIGWERYSADWLTTGRHLGMFEYVQGKRKFFSGADNNYDRPRFVDLAGGIELTRYMSRFHTNGTGASGTTLVRGSELTALADYGCCPVATEGGSLGLYLRHGRAYIAVSSINAPSGGYGSALMAVVRGASVHDAAVLGSQAAVGAPGTHAKSTNSLSVYSMALALTPGMGCLLAPTSTVVNADFDFLHANVLFGETVQHNIQRVGRLYTANYNASTCVAAMNEVFYTSSTAALAASISGYCFCVGDVFPALGLFRGQRHARLEIGQRIGRK